MKKSIKKMGEAKWDYKNLACPKCGRTITGADLKNWKCVKCGAKFKIEFTKKIK